MRVPSPLIIDDRTSNTMYATNGACWRVVTDTVMGGKSFGKLIPTVVDELPCLHLKGKVSLENNGGFVQASLDLNESGLLDGSAYIGIEVVVLGNSEMYNLHLRTDDTRVVWQSYRSTFYARPHWHTVKLPFDNFKPHRLDKQLDKRLLRRLGVVAIGRSMPANICIASVSLYP